MHGLEPAPCIAHSRSLMAKSTRASPTEPPLPPTRTRAWPGQAPQLSPLRLSCMLRRARPPGERTWQALCSQKVRREYGIVCHGRASAALSCPLCALPVTWSADRGDRNRETAIPALGLTKKKTYFASWPGPGGGQRTRWVGPRATAVFYTGLVLHDTTRMCRISGVRKVACALTPSL